MFTRTIYTEVSPQLEEWLGRSWQRILTAGLALILAGVLVLTFPRLVAFLVAMVFFLAAAVVLITAYHLWQLSRPGSSAPTDVD